MNKFTINTFGSFAGRKIGKFSDVAKFMEAFRDKTNRNFKNAVEKVAKAIEEEAKYRIDKQKFYPVPKLSANTLNNKKDPRIFVDTGFYMNNIKVGVDRKGRRLLGKGSRTYSYYFEVFPDDVIYPSGSPSRSNPVSLKDVVFWLEYGTVYKGNRQPPRPFWTTTMVDAAQEIVDNIRVGGRDALTFKVRGARK